MSADEKLDEKPDDEAGSKERTGLPVESESNADTGVGEKTGATAETGAIVDIGVIVEIGDNAEMEVNAGADASIDTGAATELSPVPEPSKPAFCCSQSPQLFCVSLLMRSRHTPLSFYQARQSTRGIDLFVYPKHQLNTTLPAE